MDSGNEIKTLAEEWGRVQAQEISLVAADLKPSARVRVRRERLPALFQLAKRLSLQLIVGYETISGQSVSGRRGFSEWCQRKICTPQTMDYCYAYLAKDHVKGQRLRRLDESQDDAAVGELLGYPSCCIAAFCQRSEAVGQARDPVLRRYAAAQSIDWRLNVSLLCFDFSLLTHIPCSPLCNNSLALAATYFDFLHQESPILAAELSHILGSWVIHTDILGVVAFTAKRVGANLKVVDILAAYPESFIGSILHQASVVEREEHSLTIDGLILTGDQSRLYQYCEI